jgi:tetratricopeptide (TPR) repeat protein
VTRRGEAERRSQRGRAEALLFGFAVAVFARSLANGFALDDLWLIKENPFVHGLAHLRRLFSSDYLAPHLRGGLYRPLVTASYALDHAIGGGHPLVFHLVNVLLHGAVCVLVFRVLSALLRERRVAAGAAFLFAAHAVHSEVVAGVAAGRPELLAGGFLLAAWLAHLAGADRPPGRRRPGLAAASAAAYGLALLSKESAAVLPALVLLGDVLLRGDPRAPLRARLAQCLARDLRLYLGYAAVAGVCLWARAAALGSLLPAGDLRDPVSNPLVELPPGSRLASALFVGLRGVALLVAPLELSYDYSFDQIPAVASPRDPRAWLAAAAALLAAAGFALAARRAPPVALALGWHALAAAPTSNLLVPTGVIFAERLLYLPSVGFCLLVALGVQALAARLPGRRAPALCAGLLAALLALHAARAGVRSADWRDSETLWLHDLSVAPRSTKVQANAGWVLLLAGRPEEALACFDRAIGIARGPGWFANPYRGRVYALVELGRLDAARESYALYARHAGPDPLAEELLARGARGGPLPPPGPR